MTSDALQAALEQNYENLKALLDALNASYDLPRPPDENARLNRIFHPGGPEAAKDVDMTEEERAAWLFEQNAKALAAAADAAGARNVKTSAVGESDGLDAVADALGGSR
jgi:hypothetical protein